MKPVDKFDHPDHGWVWRECEIRWINDRIETAVKTEREACAQACEAEASGYRSAFGNHCAHVIRMRSNGN